MKQQNNRTTQTLQALTEGLDYLFQQIAEALHSDPEQTGPLAFAFAAGYREAFATVVELLLDDTEQDAFDFTFDSADFIGALLDAVPCDRPELANAMYVATGYWTSAVPKNIRGLEIPKSPLSRKEP